MLTYLILVFTSDISIRTYARAVSTSWFVNCFAYVDRCPYVYVASENQALILTTDPEVVLEIFK